MTARFARGLSLATFIAVFASAHPPSVQAQAAPATPPAAAPVAQPAPAAAPAASAAPVAATPAAAAPAPTTATPAPTEAPAVEPTPAPPPPPVYSQPPLPAQASDPEVAPIQMTEIASVDRPRKKRSIGLMIAGLATLGASYGLSAAVGLQLSSGEATAPGEYCTNCDDGTKLLIPLAGPWLFLPDADGGDGKALSAFLGIAQATGLVLSIVGIAKFVDSAPDAGAQAMPRMMLGVAPTPHGALASMHLVF